MPHSLFISDLHLSHGHTHSTELFLRFAADIAPAAEALYILGDLFEYWAGDDDLGDPFHRQITGTLRDLGANGTRIFIMHGNRDFLMDKELGAACNATLLGDPVLLDLYGTPTLLSHGDALCTDDIEYQRFRELVRNGAWQAQFLAQPLAQRKAPDRAIAHAERIAEAQQGNGVDGCQHCDAVNELLRAHRYPRLIHGHTHRPAKHLHHLDEHSCERWVLGDWDHKANALRCDSNGISWQEFSF